MKNLIRTILDKPIISSGLKKHLLKRSVFFDRSAFYSACIENNGWIYTQQKSGTTFLCNVLAFYNARKMGIQQCSFDEIGRYGIIRSLHDNHLKLNQALSFAKTNRTVFFHTHEYIDAKPSHLIVTTRNVLDFCVSSYFFSYKNRYKKSDIDIDEALPYIVKSFCTNHDGQRRAIATADSAILINYEDLILNSMDTFASILQSVNGEVDRTLLDEVISDASVRNLKAFERKQGFAAIAPKTSYSAESFIRSGKIGEGQSFFNDRQKDLIQELLAKSNVPIDGSLS